jgi:small subunit ribosomal protein S5
MTQENKDKNIKEETNTVETVENVEVKENAPVNTNANTSTRPPRRDFKKNKKAPFNRGRKDKPRSEFDSKIIDIRRVARVSKGGRRFSFSVAVIAGDRKGRVGVGTGKAGDTALAVEKATKNAKKNMIKVLTTKSMSIPHDVQSKYCSARIMIMPARGRGVIAGSSLRDVLQYAGLNDVNSKILSGSKNKLNIARASIEALKTLKTVNKK